MRPRRPDRALRFLAAVASIAYVVMWVGTVVLLLGLPVVRALAAESSNWGWGMPVPVPERLVDARVPVVMDWGDAILEIDEARGILVLPIPGLPWRFVVGLWVYGALASGLMLSFFHHLRGILHRARDGAPFDPENARSLRLLGLLLLAIVAGKGVSEFATVRALRGGLADAGLVLPVSLHVDGGLVLLALAFLVLARVFHRGADLEHDQSLVV